MKFTLSWLKEHLDTDADVASIAAKLNSIGLEVESISDPGAALKDFIVAEIVTAEKHPQADRLRLCMVNAGDAAPLQIVCGAPNCDAGCVVPLATLGTVFKDPEGGKAFGVEVDWFGTEREGRNYLRRGWIAYVDYDQRSP